MTPELGFGVSINASTDFDPDPASEAMHAESLGFDMVTVSDHLVGKRPTYETWTMLTWMAGATERIRLGTNVLGLPYRHPAVLAKMAESLDRLSAGRLTLGLGGGGSDAEFRAFGLAIRSPREKVDAQEEALRVIRGLWEGQDVTFEGRHYSLQGGTIAPRPDHRIPLWLGSYGNRSLALAGREADGWIPSLPYAPPDRYVAKRDRVRKAAEEAGRNPDDLTYAYNVGVRIDERAERSERVVTGGVDEVVERLTGFVRMGVTFLNLWPAGGADLRERLAEEVVPKVGQAAG
jgi:probable F420-dependent oxidoreductase